MFIVHSIIEANTDAASAVAGVDSALHASVIDCGALAAVVSIVSDDAGILFDDADKVRDIGLAHNELLVKLAATLDLVPVRLGALHSDQTAVQRLVEDNAVFFAQAFEHIRGAVEVTLDVSNQAIAGLSAAATPPASGRDYLKARHAQKNIVRLAASSRETFVSTIAQDVLQISRDCKQENNQRLCVLVERSKMEAFVALIGTLQTRASANGLTLTATGPWPAYSFVGAAA
jgi:hypothetical protein